MDDALEFYDQVLEVAENGVWIGNMRARVLTGIGFIHTQHGRRCEALDLQTQALSIARNYGSRILQVAILNDLAGTHAAAARHTDAGDYYRQALALAHEFAGRRSVGARLCEELARAHDGLARLPRCNGGPVAATDQSAADIEHPPAR